MKRLKKLLLLGGALFVALCVIAIIVVGVFLNKIVKTGVETVAPTITKTTVKLESVSISPLSGSAGMVDLLVGNPEGYKAPQAISVGKAVIKIVPRSLLSDKIIVRSVEVRAPEITFEGNPLGANNLTTIMDNVSAVGGAAKTETNAPAQKGTTQKLQVDDFLIKDAKVHVSISGKELVLPLPDIHLTDLGQGPEGITPAELTKQVLAQVTSGTIKAVAGSVTDLGKGVETLGKDAGKKVGEGVKSITKGIFGK